MYAKSVVFKSCSDILLTYSFFLWDGSQVSFGDNGCGFLYHVHDSGAFRLMCVFVHSVWCECVCIPSGVSVCAFRLV